VFDPLGDEPLTYDVSGRCEGGLDIAPGVSRPGKDVAVESPHGVLFAGRRPGRICERIQHRIFDIHHRSGRPGGGLAVGDDDCEDVAEERRAAAYRDEHRPVLVNDADPEVAGDIGRCEGGNDALHGLSG